jgi:proton-coupled amino acid transporter
MTRAVYKWAEDAEAQTQAGPGRKRSHSFFIARPQPESGDLDISSIKVPGGFRRNYLQRQTHSLAPLPRGRDYGSGGSRLAVERAPPRLFTRNFIEFLTLYGHFAGEELEEDDEGLEPGEYFGDDDDLDEDDDEAGDSDPDEGRALLTPSTPGRGRRKRKERGVTGNSTAFGAVLLLLKSFVGTGVLFLPKAFLNGGMLFSNVVLLIVAALAYFCFILLVQTHEKVGGSFGDMGGVLYGKYMRVVILVSVALSQIGFVSAYIVFTAENLQAFVAAVSNCRTWVEIEFLILLELVVFLPLSLIRDISKLGFTALISDAFILLGLLYLGYYDVKTMVTNHGIADIVPFNPRDWTLFIGTAIFTFEGIGLVIPIKEAMQEPSKFPFVLAIVMAIITIAFTAIGALSYAAFGSSTKTVVLLNLPQDNKFVNAVQFLYSLAILLSTPLQLFPAIRIAENGIFTRSGKHHPYIKWKKNVFRFCLVFLCAAIAWGGAADLDKFVALIGSFACVPLVLIYPVSPAVFSLTRND